MYPLKYNKEYLTHPIFTQLESYSKFYESLSFSTMRWITRGTKAMINIDSYVFSSIQGTLESIKDILYKGRINDSYALLRKYYDSLIINLYTNLYLSDNFNTETFAVVDEINNWLQGTRKIPSFKIMSAYIINSDKAKDLTGLTYEGGQFKGSKFEKIRERCNDNAHYLYYQNILLNDNEIYLQNRTEVLNQLSADLLELFILHLSYLFYLNDHYLMSSDHIDYLDAGETPSEGSTQWVAGFIQDVFNNILLPNNPTIVALIKKNTAMNLG